MNTFVDDCRAGVTGPDQIDEYIDRWHNSQSTQSLPDFLGLTQQQYARWLTDPGVLPQLLSE